MSSDAAATRAQRRPPQVWATLSGAISYAMPDGCAEGTSKRLHCNPRGQFTLNLTTDDALRIALVTGPFGRCLFNASCRPLGTLLEKFADLGREGLDQELAWLSPG
jgi:hypothetical protein